MNCGKSINLVSAGKVRSILFFAIFSVFGFSNVIAAKYLYPEPQHGLNFTDPVTVWDEALPLGDGIMGALVWGDGHPLKISLDRNDLWDTRPVPEFHSPEYKYKTMCRWHDEGRVDDLVRLYEKTYSNPKAPTKIPAGRIEIELPGGVKFSKTTLSLSDALAETFFTDGSSAKVFVDALNPVGYIRLKNIKGVKTKLVIPPFSGKSTGVKDENIVSDDLVNLGYPAPVETVGANWHGFTQQGSEGFVFAVYLEWKETADGWLGVWSIATNKEGAEPLAVAKSRVKEGLDTGFEKTFSKHAAWWKTYWEKSGLRIPNKTVERQWYLDQYKFGAASREGYPPITLQGLWTADNGRIPPWKGDYHHDLNTELSYWPCYSGNHLPEGMGFLEWLWNTRDNCFDWTKRFFELPGLNVPMTADIDNNQLGGWRQYTHSATTAAWLSHHFYLNWKYSMDRDFLVNRAYPYLRDSAVFLEAITAKKDANGLRTIPLSASPEFYDNRPEAWFKDFTNYDLSLIRWLFAATAELADETGNKADAAYWRKILAEMPELSLGDRGELLLAKNHPVDESHRHFSHMMSIHPLGMIDLADGPKAEKTINETLKDWDKLGTSMWCGYSFAWYANVLARAGNGEKAEEQLEIFSKYFTLRNSFHCNGDQSGKGYSTFTYRPFTLEGNFASAAGLQEMLIQSHRGKILIFPAVPESWKDISFSTLRAQGAFLVSASKTGGKVSEVEITSEKGGECVLVSPFSGKELRFVMRPGQKIVLNKDPM